MVRIVCAALIAVLLAGCTSLPNVGEVAKRVDGAVRSLTGETPTPLSTLPPLPTTDVPGTAPNMPTEPNAVIPGSDRSSNWSGYAATGSGYTSVSGTWVMPQPSRTTAGIDATWVGIGGVSGHDLIQAGTEAAVDPSGTIAYDAWIEMLPASTRTVAGGDAVSVTITEQSAGTWLISMKNERTGQLYRTTVQYASTHSSVEWIEEAVSSGRRIVPLTDFGTVTFKNGGAVRDGRTLTIAGSGATPITMINGARQPLATPSALSADGKAFSVTRTSEPSSAAGVPGSGRRRRG